MSLPAALLRIVATQALIGQTFCDDKVLDSPMDPIDVIVQGPTITIYTGEAHAKPAGKSLMEVEWKYDFSFHMHLPSEVETSVGKLNVRTGGGEILFDLLWRQILKALYLSESKWAKLWRDAVNEIDSLQARPFMVETAKGVRIAAREVIFAAQTIFDPPFGALDLESWWGQAVATLKNDESPSLQKLGQLFEEYTVGDMSVTSLQSLRAYLGLTDADIAAIGLASVIDGAPPNLTSINIAAVNDGTVTANSDTPAELP